MGRHSGGLPPEDSSGDRSDETYSFSAKDPDEQDYPEQRYSARPPDESDPTPRSDAAEPPYPPEPPAPTTGSHDFGDWQRGHRSEGGRRGISIGVIGALIAVVVVVATVIVWRFFGNSLSDRSDAAAGRCIDGDASVSVIADPSISDQVGEFAKKYNETANPVGDRCVQVNVKPAGSNDVINGFVSQWPAALGDRPALWIPGSTVSAARLEAAAGNETVSDSRSLVTSPVMLAVRPALSTAMADETWATLPGLQANPAALDGLNLPGWGPLRLALPTTGDSDASYLAAEAVAAATAPAGAPASDGSAAVGTLAAAQPKLDSPTTTVAMDALLARGDPAVAQVHAVASTEQQLFERAASLPDAKANLAAWMPPGPVAVADYPTVLLAGNWLSTEQTSAASEFARFMRDPDQLAELSKAGFRTGGDDTPSSDVVDFAPVSGTLSVGDNAMRATLANVLTAPAPNGSASTVSVMLDQSMGGDDGPRSRLANVTAALNTRLQALPPGSAVGLTTFDGQESDSVVAVGPLSDPVGGQPRGAILRTSLDDLTPTTGGGVSFTTLRNVYTDAIAKFRPGQSNSILVITSGPHSDRTLNGAGLQDVIRGGADPARPVPVNVINIGDDPDRATWEAVTQLSGGKYQNLATSDSPELAAAIAATIK